VIRAYRQRLPFIIDAAQTSPARKQLELQTDCLAAVRGASSTLDSLHRRPYRSRQDTILTIKNNSDGANKQPTPV